MKKVLLMAFVICCAQSIFAQVANNCTVIGKPWIVLNGQMVSDVYPNPVGSGVSDYVLSVKSSNPGAVTVIKTEEMESLTRTQTINGLSRWFIRYKTNRARTIYTVVINCVGCIAQVYELEQPVTLSATYAN
jgi:hypothetical protein